MNALRSSAALSRFVQPGKQGIAAQHGARIVEIDGHRLSASVDFEAMTASQPGPSRVDYLVESAACPGDVHAVEIHAFKPSDLRDKKAGTVSLLRSLCPSALSAIRSWNVIVQGATPRPDQAARFRAETKIQVVGRQIHVRQLCTSR